MKPLTFTLDAGPGTLWKIHVFVHPNQKSMLANRCKNGAKGYAVAFCRQFGVDDAWGKGEERGFAAEMHFNRRDLKHDYIVHEAVHAAVAWMKLCKLDLNTYAGDQSFAEAVEHIVSGTVYYLKDRKVKLK